MLRTMLFLAATTVRRARALSALPAAARRLQRIKELEARLETATSPGDKRAARKELGTLKRSGPPSEFERVACRVATFYGFRDVAARAEIERWRSAARFWTNNDVLPLDARRGIVTLGARSRAASRRPSRNSAQVAAPGDVARKLRAALEADGAVLGSVSVASEGVNGALAVPEGRDGLAELLAAAAPELWPTVDDVKLNWDAAPADDSPFLKLSVREKKRALADGLAEPLDLSDCGEELAPEAWHAAMDGSATVLDVRNDYETALGTFQGATPLNTSTFVESWDALDAALADKPRDEPVHMFCTGGVRCVKAGAYVKQKLGFSDVRRLEQGIVAYERWREDAGAESRFRGTNFVFDKRATPEEGEGPGA